MKLYLVIVLVLCGSYADDEVPEDFASLLSQLSDDLDLRLQKRLTDVDPNLSLLDKNKKGDKEKLVNDKGSSCFYKVEGKRIIRTHDSLSNGATYIDSPTDIQNETACRLECCLRSDCDLAVFKDKGDEHACYLFACSGACLFTNHSGFTTMEKRRMAQQHETDLANLATDPPTTTTEKTTTTTTTTTSTTVPTTTQAESGKMPLFGTCLRDEDCAGTRTECLAGYCVCQQGSHAQEGICREECSRFQFECTNEGKPLSYPECIAIYDTCDGIPHCRDGSDELKCEPRSSSSSDAKTVLTGGGMLQDPQAFNTDRQQLQPWQQQFLQQQQQQQLLKAGYIPQMLGQQQPQQPLFNIGQQPPSLPGYIPQQVPAQIPSRQGQQQVLLPIQNQGLVPPQPQSPAQFPRPLNQGVIPVQNHPNQGFANSQVGGSEPDLGLLQQQLGLPNKPNLPDNSQQQQPQSSVQIPPIQQRQQLPQQQPLPQQQVVQSQSSQALSNSQAVQPGSLAQVPIAQQPSGIQNQQQQVTNIQQPIQQNTNQAPPQAANQQVIPQPQPNMGATQQQHQLIPPLMNPQQQQLPQQQQIVGQPQAGGGREVDYPAGPHQSDARPQNQQIIPVHADHMNRQHAVVDNLPAQQQIPSTITPLNNPQPQQQQQNNTPNKAIGQPLQPHGGKVQGPLGPATSQMNPGPQQVNGLNIRPQGPFNQGPDQRRKKPLGQISYTDGGAVVADSQPPIHHRNNGAGRKVQIPGIQGPHNLPVDQNGNQADYGRANWGGRLDPYLNQYGPKPTNPHRGYSGDRYGSYNYDSNPYPQGYPGNDQFYAYYDSDSPGSNTHTDYDYQYAANPSDVDDDILNELTALVEAMLEEESGKALSQGRSSSNDEEDQEESNRDGAFWDYYDTSSYVPTNGQKAPGRGAGTNSGSYIGRQQVGNANKVITPRPLIPNQRLPQNPGQPPVRGTTGRQDGQNPYLDNGGTEVGKSRPIGRPDHPNNTPNHPNNTPNHPPPRPEAPPQNHPPKPDVAPQQKIPSQPEKTNDQVPPQNAPEKIIPQKKDDTTPAPAPTTTPQPVTSTATAAPNKKPVHSGAAGASVAKHISSQDIVLNDAEKEPAVKASNKTAVVVLAMGLAVTAMLLIFVGCRLRMVKRRLRRGRPLNSNEADYLINGMYL